MRHYRIEHDGANDRKALKRILEANLDKYKLPAYVTFVTGGEELNYYAEESNINAGAVLVLERKYVG
jgi:hypothetical protein